METSRKETCGTSACTIEATVVTGFENMAKDEVIEKLGGSTVTHTGRGSIRIELSVVDVTKVLDLRSVENLYVVIKEIKDFKFGDNLEEALKRFEHLIPEADWETGLKVWSKFIPFENKVSHLPREGWGKEQPEVEQSNSLLELEVTPPDLSEKGILNNLKEEDKEETESATEIVDKGLKRPHDEVNNAEPAAKKKKVPMRPGIPAFRVTCHRSGGKHVFQSPQAAAHFGGAVQDYFGWNVDLKNFDIEVVLTVFESKVYISLGLTKISQAKRDIMHFGPTTLKPTIAYGMLRFCEVKPGDVVCDPMCGGGSIPIEAGLSYCKSMVICGDIHEKAWNRTKENIEAINQRRKDEELKPLLTDVLPWDVTNLPLRDETIDVFISDLPFGKRSGSKMNNWHLYPKALTEMARCCKKDTGRACLLTQDKKCITKAINGLRKLWRKGPTLGINIGGLAAGVFLLYRTAEPVES